MTQEEFMIMVVEEGKVRSFMTMRFSKRKLRRFQRWFFRKGQKYFGWSKWRCQREWNNYKEAFNVQVK